MDISSDSWDSSIALSALILPLFIISVSYFLAWNPGITLLTFLTRENYGGSYEGPFVLSR